MTVAMASMRLFVISEVFSQSGQAGRDKDTTEERTRKNCSFEAWQLSRTDVCQFKTLLPDFVESCCLFLPAGGRGFPDSASDVWKLNNATFAMDRKGVPTTSEGAIEVEEYWKEWNGDRVRPTSNPTPPSSAIDDGDDSVIDISGAWLFLKCIRTPDRRVTGCRKS